MLHPSAYLLRLHVDPKGRDLYEVNSLRTLEVVVCEILQIRNIQSRIDDRNVIHCFLSSEFTEPLYKLSRWRNKQWSLRSVVR